MKLTSLFLSFVLVASLSAAEPTADAVKNYPLKTCIVSDEPLGDEPVNYTHREAGKPDRLVRFCCEGCIADFKQEPAKYLTKLDRPAPTQSAAAPAAAPANASVAEQKADYPLNVCAVAGEALGSMGEPYDYVHQEAGKPDRLVRMCCKGCVKNFKKDPAKYLARIDAAAKAAQRKP